jgi:ABC-type nitrate/sulfonate/bicarbonate transport system ATPase subunit
LLLLDEPFAALDPLLRERMRGELLATRARFDVPMIVIMHDPADLEFFADRLLLFFFLLFFESKPRPACKWKVVARPASSRVSCPSNQCSGYPLH